MAALQRSSMYLTRLPNFSSRVTRYLSTSSSKAVANETFEEKNKRLGRPMSPHLSIYQPQITTIMSITHRATGLALSALMTGVAAGTLILPGTFPSYLAAVSSLALGPACIFAAKFVLAFPLTYHTANGIRHLSWDLGKGLTISNLYRTGYATLAASVLGALLLAMI